MLALKLAYRNLIGARLRTWLNVFVLSLCYIIIIWHKGILNGWNERAEHETIKWEIGGGEYWQNNYDPYDPFTIEDSHAKLSDATQNAIKNRQLTPILVAKGSMYPEGRMQPVIIKGIDPDQSILALPTQSLKESNHDIPAVVGRRIAKDNHLNIGDLMTVRWRDVNGTFDATDVRIADIFSTEVQSVDVGTIWIPLDQLRSMMRMPGEATILVTDKDTGSMGTIPGFSWKGYDVLLSDIREMIKAKSMGGYVLYTIMLLLAMLAIFDTQVLAIFRRQKEIGTHVAMGMTRGQVVALFTVEGAMYAILAAIVGAIYGIPLLTYAAIKGFAVPGAMDDYGMAIGAAIYPTYSIALVIGTTLVILLTTIIVSYLPARRISKMNPTDAIRGKIQ